MSASPSPSENERNCSRRIVVAALLDIALFYNAQRLTLWSGVERELLLHFTAGIIAIIVVVLLFKVLRQGTAFQGIAACGLLLLPLAALASVIPTLWTLR
jgi:hypothetical protein